MIRIYGRATSSNVQTVMWLVGELGLRHERLDYGHLHGGLDDPAFRAINPHGLVPALVDGDLSVFESSAILRYLAARYASGGPFWPEDAAARARIDKWAEWAKTTLAPAFTAPIFWSRVRTPAAERDEAALAAAIGRFEDHLASLAVALCDKPFICGGDLTLADIVAGHVLFRYFDIDIPRSPPPAIRDYYDRLCERPAYREHVMVSYEPLRAEGA
ncbi:MAG: glutathione S-transferase family protein [Pseudomonadota bacterium]